MLTKQELERLQSADIRELDKTRLTDLSNIIHLNRKREESERMDCFEKAVANPYTFTASELIVKIAFSADTSLDTALARGLCG